MKNLVFNPLQTIKKGMPGSVKSTTKGLLARGTGFPWKGKSGIFFNLWAKSESTVKQTVKQQKPIVFPVNQSATLPAENKVKVAADSHLAKQELQAKDKYLSDENQIVQSKAEDQSNSIKLLDTEISLPVTAQENLSFMNLLNSTPILKSLVQAVVNSPDVQNQSTLAGARLVKVNFTVHQPQTSSGILNNQSVPNTTPINSNTAVNQVASETKTISQKTQLKKMQGVQPQNVDGTIKTTQIEKNNGTIYLKNMSGLMWQPVEDGQEVQQIMRQLNPEQVAELKVDIQATKDAGQSNIFKVSMDPVQKESPSLKALASNENSELSIPRVETTSAEQKAAVKANYTENIEAQANTNNKTLSSTLSMEHSGSSKSNVSAKTNPVEMNGKQVTQESKTSDSKPFIEPANATSSKMTTKTDPVENIGKGVTEENKVSNLSETAKQAEVQKQPSAGNIRNDLKKTMNSAANLVKSNKHVNVEQQPAGEKISTAKNSAHNENSQSIDMVLKVKTEEKVEGQNTSGTSSNSQNSNNLFQGTQKSVVENSSESKILKIQIHQLNHAQNSSNHSMAPLSRHGVESNSNMEHFIARIKELVDQVQHTKLHHGSIRMSLDETPMGKLDLKFQQHDKQLTVLVENEQIRNELVKLSPIIQQNLSDRGIVLNSFQVNVGQFAQSENGKQMTSKKRGQSFNSLTSGKEVNHHESQSTLINRKFGYNTMEITV